MRIPRALAATAAALTLVLAGCSSDSSDASSGGGDGFNDADVDFASDMIQHHAQALQMVDLTMGRNLDPEVARLTEDIRAAQAPEIELMVDWLEDWDQPIPETSRDHANAHSEDHGGGGEMDEDMPGMMGAEDMETLETAPEQEFQDLWLEMMVEHHEGAVAMSEEVLEDGENADVKALAEDIVETQQAEIATMQDLLEG
ncbi:MAG TPA: DUF305 domain-containing protein [Nocardioidaceae bacterium]